ncbi:MAG TPA: hypothetical protein VKA10_05555 [Prolixibacteraceae bacterium]|nr:hypothetical protein [Prolixibacteraceae bacterium]
MESVAKLIYRSNMTYFPTILPVQFYGMPDGKVYIIYARFYEIEFDRTYQEFVFAEHKEFSYDYDGEKLVPHDSALRNKYVYNEMVDKPAPKIIIHKIHRNLNSYAEAYNELNKKARIMLQNKENKPQMQITKFKDEKDNNLTATG